MSFISGRTFRWHTLFLAGLIFFRPVFHISMANSQENGPGSDTAEEIDFSSTEEKDDLSSLKNDLGVDVGDEKGKKGTKDAAVDKDEGSFSKVKEDGEAPEEAADKGAKDVATKPAEKGKEQLDEATEGPDKDGEGEATAKEDSTEKEPVEGSLILDRPDSKKGKEDLPSTKRPGKKEKVADKGSEGQKATDGKNDLKKVDDLEFDVGKEEKDLLRISKFIENKIPDKEWHELAAVPKLDKYTVMEGDYLWKISKKLFGSGFYYSKIWSLNPYITNPHEIKPNMVLVFDLGDADSMPTIKVGEFIKTGKEGEGVKDTFEFSNFGDEAEPNWVKEKKKLVSGGTYVQYATEKTYDDLSKASQISLIKEYEKYSPPSMDLDLNKHADEYDSTGFDKNSKVIYNFKEGFSLNTFITTNLVQDFGEVDAATKEGIYLNKFDPIFVRFDASLNVFPGDKFSIYSAAGKSSYKDSDRSGFKYIIVGQIQTVRKISDVWECTILDNNGLIQRKDRITVYTPKIEQITKTFNPRNIEAMIVDSHDTMKTKFSFGDVVFLDRGRADGVEMGNIFEVFSFTDKGTDRKITPDPTYKIGELTVITLTDNFSTGLVSSSSDEIPMGAYAVTKTLESAALSNRVARKDAVKEVQSLENKALDELDVELNLEDINDDLLKKADKVELAEDELEELEKQEREKSIIQKGEKDIRELERLEKDIESAETQLNSAKVDEDKNLEQQDLNKIEKKGQAHAKDLFDSLNEIERSDGKKYLDEDLNSKENPYGLTEFDLEEIDELLNTTSK